jgi:hypothetical protein
MRPVGQPRQTGLAVATQPDVHRLTRHPIAFSDLNSGNAAGDDLHDGAITLLHDVYSTSISPGPLQRDNSRAKQIRGRQCHSSFEASVSPINRSQTLPRHRRLWRVALLRYRSICGLDSFVDDSVDDAIPLGGVELTGILKLDADCPSDDVRGRLACLLPEVRVDGPSQPGNADY